MTTVSDRIRAWIDSYGDPLTLYREVYLATPEALNMKALGRFWTPEFVKAHSPFGKLDNVSGTMPYILKIQAPRSGVDELETIATMKRYPEEREIRLKSGTRVKLLEMLDSSKKSVHIPKSNVVIAMGTKRESTMKSEVIQTIVALAKEDVDAALVIAQIHVGMSTERNKALRALPIGTILSVAEDDVFNSKNIYILRTVDGWLKVIPKHYQNRWYLQDIQGKTNPEQLPEATKIELVLEGIKPHKAIQHPAHLAALAPGTHLIHDAYQATFTKQSNGKWEDSRYPNKLVESKHMDAMMGVGKGFLLID